MTDFETTYMTIATIFLVFLILGPLLLVIGIILGMVAGWLMNKFFRV